MKKFVKKLLAKYVLYVEIIGYGFVLLFIGGLIALSFIKAEDEYATLNGTLEIQSFLIKFDKPHYIIEQLADSHAVVSSNTPLLEITADEKFIADQTIIDNLQQQIESANRVSRYALAHRLSALALDIEKTEYRNLEISTMRTATDGEVIFFPDHNNFIPADVAIGGVFDFEDCVIRVTDFPADKRMKKKLKPNQTGTAKVNIDPLTSVELSVSLSSIDEKEAILEITEFTPESKLQIAQHISALPDSVHIPSAINVLVGWKSWMRLIWR